MQARFFMRVLYFIIVRISKASIFSLFTVIFHFPTAKKAAKRRGRRGLYNLSRRAFSRF